MTLRSRYEQAVRDLQERVAGMRRDGASAETIARAMHAERRRLAVLFKGLTPEPYRTRVHERTVRVYGSEDGPSIDFLRAKGKSWEAIIESAVRPGPGIGPPVEQAGGATDNQASRHGSSEAQVESIADQGGWVPDGAARWVYPVV